MYDFDQLLPTEILNRLDSKNVDIDLILNGKDCHGQWPNCRISVGENEIFNGPIIQQQLIKESRDIINSPAVIKIEYYGKTDQHTKINDQGEIIANQMVEISQFKLNGVDIIKNGLIYQAEYFMQLDTNKETYFNEHGIPTKNHDYHFYENGIWSLQIEIPVLLYIINNTKQMETFEKTPYNNIIRDIIKKLEI